MTNVAVYFCSGYKDITNDEFEDFYIPRLKEIIQNTNSKYILGDSNTFNLKCLEYLLSQNIDVTNITIHCIKDVNNGNEELQTLIKKYNLSCVEFLNKNERDEFSTNISTDDILWIRDEDSNDLNASRVYRNYLRRLKQKALNIFK